MYNYLPTNWLYTSAFSAASAKASPQMAADLALASAQISNDEAVRAKTLALELDNALLAVTQSRGILSPEEKQYVAQLRALSNTAKRAAESVAPLAGEAISAASRVLANPNEATAVAAYNAMEQVNMASGNAKKLADEISGVLGRPIKRPVKKKRPSPA